MKPRAEFRLRRVGQFRAIWTTTAVTLAVLCSSCLDSAANKVTEEVQTALNSLNSTSHDWQNTLKGLEDELRKDSSDLARSTLQQVQQIAAESIQLASEQVACNEDIITDHATVSLANILHTLKHDGKHETYIPHICSITPPAISLQRPENHLTINGSFFFATGKPRLAVQNGNTGPTAVTVDAVSRNTNYAMTVEIAPLIQAGTLNAQSIRLLIYDPPNSSSPYEVPIEQAPTCSDNIRNGDETDIDCGGSCKPCQVGLSCSIDDDCTGKACIAQRCGVHSIIDARSGWTKFGGGTGGDHNELSQCGTGKVAVGFLAKTGDNFDRIGLYCSTLLGDGSVGTPTPPDTVGGPGGKREQSWFCPRPGQVLVGLFGRTGDKLDQVGGLCAFPRDLALGVPQVEPEPPINPIAPSQGGTSVRVTCGASNLALKALGVRVADQIYSMSFQCSPISRATLNPGQVQAQQLFQH